MNKKELLEKYNPAAFSVILGYPCSNNCFYCYNKKNNIKDFNLIMDKKTLEQVLIFYENYLKEDLLEHKPQIGFIGGEIFEYWDKLDLKVFFEKLVKITRNYGKKIDITTNGLFITDSHIQFFKQYKDDFQIHISLDGIKESHDKNRITKNGEPTWEKVFNIIKKCSENNLNIFIQGVITPNNVQFLYQNYLLFKECYEKYQSPFRFGIDSYQFWPENELKLLSIGFDEIYKDCIKNYDESLKSFINFKQINTFLNSTSTSKTSIAILPSGELKMNTPLPLFIHELPENKTFENVLLLGDVYQGIDFQKLEEIISIFGPLDNFFFQGTNEKEVCENCIGNKKNICLNPYNNKIKIKLWGKNDHPIRCYQLRLQLIPLMRYLKKYGYID